MKLWRPALILSLGLHTLLSSPVAKAEADPALPNLQCQHATLNTTNMGSFPVMVFCADTPYSSSNIKTISAQQFVAYSLQSSPSLQSQQDLVESAKYSLRSAKGSWWPNASMSNSSLLFVNNIGNNNANVTGCTNNPSTAGTSFNPFNGSTSSCSASSQYTQAYPVITITWNFLNPSRYPQIAGAQRSLFLAESQLKQANQQLQLELLKSYGTYLLAGYQLGELNSLVQIESKIMNLTSKLVKSRAVARYQSNQESRNLFSYQARLESALALQRQAKMQLTAALAKVSEQDQNILPDINSLHVREWNYNAEQSIDLALKNSESIRQLKLQSGISMDNANQLRGSILPTIGFLGYVTYQGTDSSGSFSNLVSSYAGLSVTWNLFDGYTTKNQAIAADRQASSYLHQMDESERQLRLLIQNKLISLKSLRNQINLYISDIHNAQAIASDLTTRQKFGISTSLEVLQALQDNHESKLRLIGAISEYVTNYTELSYLCGINPLT